MRRLIAGAGLAALVLGTFTSPAHAAEPLREHAADRGRFIGTAVATGPLASETAYSSIAGTEFNQITPENAMKWDATEPSDGSYSFAGADQIVAFAQQHDQQIHGHTLVWHSQTPGWVQGLSATAMRTAMQDHISTLLTRYAGKVGSWDVVNEAFEESGAMRTSFWYNTLGQGYVAEAFRAARAADPAAKLCINDYNVEGINAKSTAMYNLVSTLRAQGVPIDCVGFQAHLATQYGLPGQIRENVQRFADLGVQVRFTELDVRMPTPRDAAKDATQAAYYRDVVNACLAVTRCAGITLWGFTDKYSWVPDTFPGQGAALIYDASYAKKPAYTAVHDALAGDVTPADTTPPTAPANPAATGTTSSGTTLSWTAATDDVGVTGYDILRATGSGAFTAAGTSTTTSFTDTGLSPSTAYRYQVRARDAAGNLSPVSTTVAITTLAGTGAGGCSVTGTVQTQWNGGYVVQPVTVKNTGTTPLTGWTVTFTLPAGHTVTGFWNAALTVSGQTVTARNMAYNGTLAAGASTAFGFQASRPGSDTALPTTYACEGR